MAADGARTWIPTGSPENDAATAARGPCTVADADAAALMERVYAAAGVSA